MEGIGEDTCASLRCRHHRTEPKDDWTDDEWDETPRRDGRSSKRRRKIKPPPTLRAFELPFAYEEAGQRKEALVKVKLCGRCEGKLKWKPPIEGSSGEEDRKATKRTHEDDSDSDDRRGKRR